MALDLFDAYRYTLGRDWPTGKRSSNAPCPACGAVNGSDFVFMRDGFSIWCNSGCKTCGLTKPGSAILVKDVLSSADIARYKDSLPPDYKPPAFEIPQKVQEKQPVKTGIMRHAFPGESEYLLNKALPPQWGWMLDSGAMLVPLRHPGKKSVCGIQIINADGSKRLVTDSEMGIHVIAWRGSDCETLICEGVADAIAMAHCLKDKNVVAGICAGVLPDRAKQIGASVVADNDHLLKTQIEKCLERGVKIYTTFVGKDPADELLELGTVKLIECKCWE